MMCERKVRQKKAPWLHVCFGTGENDLFAVYMQRFNLYYNKTLNVVNRAGQKMLSQRDGECVWADSHR